MPIAISIWGLLLPNSSYYLCWIKIRSNGIGYIVSIQSVQKETFIINAVLMQKFRKSEYKYKS